MREAGYEFACVSRQDSVRPGSDPYVLPRLWARNRADGVFARRVRRYVRPGAAAAGGDS